MPVTRDCSGARVFRPGDDSIALNPCSDNRDRTTPPETLRVFKTACCHSAKLLIRGKIRVLGSPIVEVPVALLQGKSLARHECGPLVPQRRPERPTHCIGVQENP